MNPQLISYYFGGKRGLLEELRRRWAATEATLVRPEASFAEAVEAYLDATLDRPAWARLVIWQALGDERDHDEQAALQQAKLQESLKRIRGRQQAGEITVAVDAEIVLLLSFAVAFAPIALPNIVAAIFGAEQP